MSEQANKSNREFEPQGFHAGLLVAATNWVGAGISVFLVLGLVFWGYNLSMRDVNDIPVVRALEVPMRIKPDDPGGAQVAYQGLAVNKVQADGGVATPPDEVVLAPAPVSLADEDAALGTLDPKPRSLEDVSAPAVVDTRAAIEDAIKAAVAEDTGLSEAARRLAALPGVKRSPRPRPRRVRLAALGGATRAPAAAGASAVDLDPARLVPGMRLVQIGAYDDRATAIRGWEDVMARHGKLMDGHKRLIQKAESGGRAFYRLRIAGFGDLADSRRFCAALVAGGTRCIPVPAR